MAYLLQLTKWVDYIQDSRGQFRRGAMMRFEHSDRAGKGFTLLELLIVVAIIGVIAILVVPNLLDSLQKAKQKRTVGDMRDVGTAWYSWFTDQVSAAAAGASATSGIYRFSDLDTPLTADQLLQTLFPSLEHFYIQEVPTNDGWGAPYDYAWSPVMDYAAVIGIRSLGRDHEEGPAMDPYTMGPFDANDYSEDIVWADGFFVRYPAGISVQ